MKNVIKDGIKFVEVNAPTVRGYDKAAAPGLTGKLFIDCLRLWREYHAERRERKRKERKEK